MSSLIFPTLMAAGTVASVEPTICLYTPIKARVFGSRIPTTGRKTASVSLLCTGARLIQ